MVEDCSYGNEDTQEDGKRLKRFCPFAGRGKLSLKL